MPNDDLNPIFDFAANGKRSEAKGDYANAVSWYHRALACLPNLYGFDKQIKFTPKCNFDPSQFTRQHAARIYSAMGACLVSMDRPQDGRLALEAACLLNPSDTLSAQQLQGLDATRHTSDAVPNPVHGGDTSSGNAKEVDLSPYLTLIMVTHCTRSLKRFRALLPPSSKLVTATYGSLVNVFGDTVRRCPKVLCYDAGAPGGERERLYGQSLELFAQQHGFELHIYPGIGLFNTMTRVIASVSTPYILFIEHDWLFRGEAIQLGSIIQLMEENHDIATIRFNKRNNQINGMDFIVTVDCPQRNVPLLRTSTYSNNPSVIRADRLKNRWLPICAQTLEHVSDKLGGSPFGVEEILFRRFVKDIRQCGFDQAHTAWGTFIYGKMGDPPRLVHLGE